MGRYDVVCGRSHPSRDLSCTRPPGHSGYCRTQRAGEDTEWALEARSVATCGAIGPPSRTDGFPLMCTREPGHSGRHRNQRGRTDVPWTHAYEPIHKDGELVSSYRPRGLPGPDPTMERLRAAGLEIKRTRRTPASSTTSPTRDPYGGYEQPTSWTSLEYPACAAVEISELAPGHCRRAWYKHHRGQPLAHVCVRTNCNGKDTCRCACGKRRDSWRFRPLPPASRPEAPLDDGGTR